ncbi:MAG: hypothetical protein FWC73_01880 [Defluviitaleaceae bacterium]|nr:hypothetical protein [Defluviitaleaceae bacterium]
MQVRRAKGISLDSLAHVIKSNKTFVHRLEHGQAECSSEMLIAIRKFLEIENAPILEHELQLYKSRLWVLHNMLNTHSIEEIKALLNELSPILDLPFEHDLRLLFMLMGVRILIRESNFTVAEDKLNEIEPLMINTSGEAFCMFSSLQGFFCAYRAAHKDALRHFLQALEIESEYIKPNAALLTNIGMLYMSIGKPYHAISSLERAIREFGGSHTVNPHTSSMLAMAYTIIGEYRQAKKLYDASIIQAKSINDKIMQGLTLSNMSVLSVRIGNYEEGINYCNQALECYNDKGFQSKIVFIGQKNAAQCIALFNKGRGLQKMKEYAKCQEVIEHGRSLAEDDNKFTIGFNILECLITMDNNDSIKYLEEVAVPYYKAGDGLDKLIALDICKELETHYNKKRAKTKASAFGCIARDIYEEMFFGEIDIE